VVWEHDGLKPAVVGVGDVGHGWLKRHVIVAHKFRTNFERNSKRERVKRSGKTTRPGKVCRISAELISFQLPT
jgi:hypothetical protein